MKEVVLTRPPYMNASEQRIADMHSVLNILNLLIGELFPFEPKDPDLLDRFKQLEDELCDITRKIKEGGEIVDVLLRMRKSEDAVISFVKAALQDEETAIRRAEIQKSIENFESVFSVLKRRLDEFEMRMDDPNVWIRIEPDAFRKEVEDFFIAIAKNAKGSYGIQFNLARKKQGDYYVDLRVDVQPEGAHLWMPLRLKDVLRDLTANARKYTTPGGRVALAIYQDEEKIHAVIEDSGCGIPAVELDKVADFGYRASNVKARPTKGGGFGLTKAAWLVTSWGGQLSITSALDEGTTVRITIPDKEET